ncbi:hypothetical protein ABK040_000056 [Willaertia magna]
MQVLTFRRLSSPFLLLLIFILCSFINAMDSQEKFDEITCENLGFKSSELNCETCKEFKLYMNEKAIIDNCNKCCQQSNNLTENNNLNKDLLKKKEFNKGYLIYCNCNIRSFPEVGNFMKSYLNKFNNLSLRHQNGAMPSLLMTRKDGSEEVLSIKNWNMNEIREFLQEKLEE